MTFGEDTGPADGATRRGAFSRPHLAMLALVGLGTALGWAYLAAMVAAMVPEMDMTSFGPGMGVFNFFNRFDGLPPDVRAALAALCLPTGGHFGMPSTGPWGVSDLALVFAMWVTMVAAMMLPTAAPMLSRVADTAEARRSGAAPVALVAAGYVGVWIGFAAVATLGQWGLTSLRMMSPAMGPVTLVLAATTLVAAGLYQFTPLKHACLVRCRRPVAYYDAAWTDRPGRFLRLGVDEGLNCLGCCAALMAVMFAVGVMNVVWIAVLGIVMFVEKTTLSIGASRAIGVLLVAWGLALAALSPAGQRLLGL